MPLRRSTLGASSLASFLVFAACAVLFFSSCAYARGGEKEIPAPSSSLTKAQALKVADAFIADDPFNRSRSLVASTGSMLPVLASNHVLLLERATGRDLDRGDIAILRPERGRGTIVHRVTDKSRTGGVFTKGDNNARADGWFFPERVEWRVAGVIYFRKNAN